MHRPSLSFKHMLCEGCASLDFSVGAQLLHNESIYAVLIALNTMLNYQQ